MGHNMSYMCCGSTGHRALPVRGKVVYVLHPSGMYWPPIATSIQGMVATSNIMLSYVIQFAASL